MEADKQIFIPYMERKEETERRGMIRDIGAWV